ncbi:hypothetical protein ACGFX4_28255 [Kitasatospora sp. NPDC048365]|uniref:hypothetical protein n=1 Tax=Kitasatospora sp. NPDC048365 TaxID=3364050 RepID=UPI003719EBAD
MGETELRLLLADAADEAGPLEASREAVLRAVRRRRRRRTAAGGLATAAVVLGAVVTTQLASGAGLPARPALGTPAAPAADTPRPGCIADPAPVTQSAPPWLTKDSACRYLGLTLEAARAKAATEHRYVTIRSQDGTNYTITYVYDLSRIVVDVVHNRVTAASVG